MKRNNYTVYMHTCPNGKRYVGITQQEPRKRWLNGKGYKKNSLFYRAISKYGFENISHEILIEGLTQEQAEQKEIELIAKYQTNNSRYGYNIANGGNTTGTHSEESKKKMSKSAKGKKFSDEARKNMSIAQSGVNHANIRPINQYDKQGNLIKEWAYVKLAAQELGISAPCIRACAMHMKGKKTVLGFIWRYKDDETPLLGIDDVERYRSRRVNQYNIDGTYIATFTNCVHAAESNGLSAHASVGIAACCRGKRKTSCSYIWRYKDDDRPINIDDIAKWQVKKGNKYVWEFKDNEKDA